MANNEKDVQQKIAEMAEQHFQAKKAKVEQEIDNSQEESEETRKANAKVSEDLQELENTVTELQQALLSAEKKVKENQETAMRFRADVENVRRQADRDIANAHKYGIEKFASGLLPILDSLENGIATIEKDQTQNDPKYNSLCEGMQMTYKLFTDMLLKFNVAVIDPLGDKFDPHWHEAIAMQPSAEVDPGTVLIVVQKGYRLHDRVMRPARVIVAREG
ncbi:MAG: nucleotide exchange factor GrpE [Gammaproteobacteria bacterium]